MPAIDTYLNQVLERNGSDLHFMAGDPARVRQYGELKALSPEPLAPDMVKAALYEIMPKLSVERFEAKDGTDFAYSMPGVARFRVNVMRQLNGMGAVFRAIPSTARTAAELKLPEAVMNLCKINSGLILVTGKTGSGKSTTLAAMIDDINNREKGHILTIEDPIEFVHESKRCLVNQREVHRDTLGFSEALRSALREDPDVVLVGEMRDLETIRLALTAAETGHLVFGTLHTSSAAKTIDRIVDVFPAAEKDMVRAMMSESLRAVISQTLMKRVGGGRIAAHEIMIGTPAIRNLIREGKIAQMYSAIQTGQGQGMQTLDQCLQELVAKGVVSREEAKYKAQNKDSI